MKILLVEDDPRLSRSLARLLEQDRHNVEVAANGETGIDIALGENGIDVVILDIGLPDLSGLEVARQIRREKRELAILMLTARDTVGDRVTGLDSGADDYVVKPFSVEELLARVHAVLRRSAPDEAREGVLRVADLELDENSHEVTRAGVEVHLTATEFELLRYLMRNERVVLSKAQILDRVWQYDFGGQGNVVELYISYLRRKIDRGREPMIHTLRGAGYMIKPASS